MPDGLRARCRCYVRNLLYVRSSGVLRLACRNVFDGQWHLFDDARVTTVSSELDVRTRAAYVLFYSRVDFRDYSKHMLE